MKRKLCCLLTALLIGMSLTACLDDFDEYDTEYEEGTSETGGNTSVTRNSVLVVDNSTGALTINRPVRSEEVPMGESGTWTVFVYICGSDLESQYGMGTADMEEMLEASTGDKVRFVVQTGGANSWKMDGVNSNELQRFVIQNGQIEEVYSDSAKNMGDIAVITDFLRWGIKEYPAAKMALVFWNHGSGCISGACFDELNDNDSLSLLEMDSALYSVFGDMTDKFELIGFDACLMGTVETANVLANYSRYMVGSEEVESGYGWDYTVIGNFLGSNPDADGASLGKAICDGFKASNVACNDDELTTLSVINLNKLDTLLTAFNSFSKEMYEAGSDANTVSEMIRNIEGVENFGGNNKSEGYTNMVDMGGLIEACSSYTSGSAGSAISALNDCVEYKVSGNTHVNASGLSIYYPLEIQGSAELSIFQTICVSPYYLQFVDRQGTGAIYADEDYINQVVQPIEEEQPVVVEQPEEEEQPTVDVQTEEVKPEETVTEEESQTEETKPEEDVQTEEPQQEEGPAEETQTQEEQPAEENTNSEEGTEEVEVEVYWYDTDGWYDPSWCYQDDNCWYSCDEYEYDENSQCYRRQPAGKEHWEYADSIEQTGESRLITFESAPAFNEDGYYSFKLDDKGLENTAGVYAIIYMVSDDGQDYIEIGETFDVEADWDNGVFEDMFDGLWLALPDGQTLATYIVEYTDDYVIYTSPILLNGEETNLRIKQDANGITIEGAWDGIDESGAASRNITKLQDGDIIVPCYFSYDVDTFEEGEWEGYEYEVEGTLEINYDYLLDADYCYAFCIDDVYYDYYLTDFVDFNLDEDGNVSYYVDQCNWGRGSFTPFFAGPAGPAFYIFPLIHTL